MPGGSRRDRVMWLARQLREIGPDAIWVQENPTDPFALEILALYRFRRRPRIVSAVSATIFARPRRSEALARRLLWPRLDAVMAVAPPSAAGIRAAGMPASVPIREYVAGILEPAGEIVPFQLPFERNDRDFIVGFAGRLAEEKGWKDLLSALRSLPSEFRLVIVGDGPQLPEVRQVVSTPGFKGRVFYGGLLAREELWGFYEAVDCLAVPSLTTPSWMESFGGVVADAMSLGLPIVGSACGAIPGVLGDAGIIVAENDAQALARALMELASDRELCARLGSAGQARFRREFSIAAYSGKVASALSLVPRDRSLPRESIHDHPA